MDNSIIELGFKTADSRGDYVNGFKQSQNGINVYKTKNNEATKIFPISIGGGCRIGFQAVSISPARDAWASSKL